MVDGMLSFNARLLEADFHWLQRVLEARMLPYTEPDVDPSAIEAKIAALIPPPIDPVGSLYGEFVAHYELSSAERLILVLALVPHVRPQLLDPLSSSSIRPGTSWA